MFNSQLYLYLLKKRKQQYKHHKHKAQYRQQQAENGNYNQIILNGGLRLRWGKINAYERGVLGVAKRYLKICQIRMNIYTVPNIIPREENVIEQLECVLNMTVCIVAIRERIPKQAQLQHTPSQIWGNNPLSSYIALFTGLVLGIAIAAVTIVIIICVIIIVVFISYR